MDDDVEEKNMSIQDYIKGLKRSSKSDDIPGTVEAYLDELCPACGNKMKLMRPCCSEKRFTKVCICGYKQFVE